MHRDQLHIASPCSADWGAMRGDGARRFCDQCRKHVHDLSAMTEPDAAALVAGNASICVRYAASTEGTVRHTPNTTSRWSKLLALGAALVSTPALASGIAVQPSTAPAPEPTLIERMARKFADLALVPAPIVHEQGEVVRMGDIALPPPPPPPPPTDNVVRMGRIAPPSHDPAPPADPPAPPPTTTRLPRPPAGSSVIPEVEEALDRQEP